MIALASATLAAATVAAHSLNIGWLPPGDTPAERKVAAHTVESYLSGMLGMPVHVVTARSYQDAVAACLSGSTPVAYLGAFGYIQAHDRGDFVPMAQRKDGKLTRSVFIANVDSGVRTLEDLRGRTFAFGERTSTSGYVMPMYFLDLNDLPARGTFRSSTHVKGDRAVMSAVLDFKVDAGVINDKYLNRMRREGRYKPGQVNIVWESPPFPDSLWCASKTLGAPMLDRISNAFTSLSPDRREDGPVLKALEADGFYRPRHEQYGRVHDAVLLEGLLTD